MTSFGRSLREVDLRNAGSIRELQQKTTEYANEHCEERWILGGRWDQELFVEKRYPTCKDLDTAVRDRPVFLMRVCGHIGVANSKALELAGITKETAVAGGKVDLGEVTGEPNGILRENALELMWKKVHRRTGKELEKACLAACRKAVEAGLTCVHWMVTSGKEMKAIQRLHAERKLPLRVYLGIDVEFIDELTSLGLLTGFGSDMAKIGFVKILADGSMGGRTAAMKKPYSDELGTSGMMLYTQGKLNKLVQKAHRAGLQLAIHAIGDRAVDSVLKAYEKALKEFPRANHRHRIEHCSVLNPRLIKRMKRLNLVASVQPHFIVSDFWAIDRVGKARARWVFPFKKLIQEGIVVASGSDCPVELINPILGIWGAVARKSFPEESLTVEEALRTYTINAAYASFDEDKRGTIEVGKLADLTVLSDDPFSIAPDKIREVSVEKTIVDGKVVYTK
jgi:predicted amidohydrolase YtcJ